MKIGREARPRAKRMRRRRGRISKGAIDAALLGCLNSSRLLQARQLELGSRQEWK